MGLVLLRVGALVEATLAAMNVDSRNKATEQLANRTRWKLHHHYYMYHHYQHEELDASSFHGEIYTQVAMASRNLPEQGPPPHDPYNDL